ncbi:MFS transporter [Actinopolymorpha sp. B9G3]|uniref:MFS transporter n=1 Tax=Actinopolymorpha sp. B9G3 TaxID=3158970 RepID=UPI0032D948DA
MISVQLNRWTLWFGGLAFFSCYLGQTVLGVVQPTIAAELRLSSAEAQWVVNSFFLTLALFAPAGGRLSDYYGHRNVLLVALSVFALGSFSAAVSQGFFWLVSSIAVAGIGASTLYPASAAMIANRVPLRSRGDALGKYSAIGVSVFVVGPLLAGALTEVVSWRALFGVQAAVGIGLVLMGWQKVEDRPVGEPERFDVRGLVVVMSGLTALLVALMQALTWGWDSAATLALAGCGVVVLGAFCLLELRTPHPQLDVGLLRRRVLCGIVLAMFTAQFVITGYIIYAATYFQHVLGYGPLLAALAIVPSMLAAPAFNVIAGRATDRIGARLPAILGYFATAVAFGWLAAFLDERRYILLLPGLLLLSTSFSPMFTSLLTGLSNAVAAQERGDANALVLTVRWIGAAAGTMVLGVIIHAGSESARVPTAPPYQTAFVVLSAAALVGGLICILLLRDPAPEQRPIHHHFRPHF